MALIPDTAIKQFKKLTPAAISVYSYYCMKRNHKTGGWSCPDASVAKDMGMSRSRVCEVRAELIEKKWIEVGPKSFVRPLMGFASVEISTLTPAAPVENSIEKQSSSKEVAESVENSTGLPSENVEIPTLCNSSPVENSTIVGISTPEMSVAVENSTLTVENSTDIYKELPAHLPAQKKENMSSSENSTNTEVAHPELPKKAKPTRDEQIGEVFDHWKAVHKHPKAKLDKKRKKAINDRLAEGFEIADLKLAIDGCLLSPFHQGDNREGKVYDAITLICRDVQHVEDFIGFVEKAREMRSTQGNGATVSQTNFYQPRAPAKQINAANTPLDQFVEHCVAEFERTLQTQKLGDFVEGELIPAI